MAKRDVKVVQLPRDATTPAEVKNAIKDELNAGYQIEGIYTSNSGGTKYHWAIMKKRVTI